MKIYKINTRSNKLAESIQAIKEAELNTQSNLMNIDF